MFHEHLSEEKKRRIRSKLFQRFIFLKFMELIQASSTGRVVNGVTLLPRIAMVIFYQPEEGAFLCLKSKDSYMDCTLCTLLSRIMTRRTSNYGTQIHGQDSSDDYMSRRQAGSSIQNSFVQLHPSAHDSRQVTNKITHQLIISLHKTRKLLNVD